MTRALGELRDRPHGTGGGQGRSRREAEGVREGHARVPRPHREGGTSLGTWLNNQKSRRDKLTPEQLGRLEALGVAW
ncbi:helicase associated domain-containing protein [Kitasatospora sp. DSM 101779]|uniref:helicase associated domain-containing protein n=1 Tax=Kitasatospora sp. DSM 101779 TaxID=2853165 RepID=UPI0021D9D33E|nr:helicase associated domain-containing protein [Kitasatospora sp. DSM 101779]